MIDSSRCTKFIGWAAMYPTCAVDVVALMDNAAPAVAVTAAIAAADVATFVVGNIEAVVVCPAADAAATDRILLRECWVDCGFPETRADNSREDELSCCG